MSYTEVLRKAPVLQGLSTEQLEAMLVSNTIMAYQAGQVVFEENSIGREIYIVLTGQVAVQVDPAKLGTVEKGSTQTRIIRTFGPGESFGEVAVIDKQPREAAIVATENDTKLLVLPPHLFDNVLQAQVIMSNITRDLSDKLRGSNTRLIQSMLSSYFLTALVEQLTAQTQECNPIIPLQKLIVIRSPENFILSGPNCLLAHLPEKETIEISFFSEPAIMQRLLGPGEPSGAVAFNALFSIIRSGQISERIAERSCRYELQPATDRRSGRLMVWKTIDDHTRPYTLEWQIKGATYNPETRASNAALFLYIYDDEAASTRSRAGQIIANIAMPVQKYIYDTLPRNPTEAAKFRAIIIHHRSHETARTLRTIQDLGYQIDTFIGIPYGDVNWDYITMLDHASNHNYMSLKLITHPTQPTRYQFDFRQSSFLETQTEREIAALYDNPAISGDYLAAMQALAEYRLAGALQKCRERGEQLIIYEDGGYIVSKIYEIYKNSRHPHYALVRAAVDDGLIAGVVEVTVAGERKNLQVIEENNGQALLPVLSNARSDIKAVFEAMGVGEAVIHASSTSFGRLGLPTFQTRRIAVIGGNGAIGTRVVEQLTALHNSTANVFAIDISDRSFSLEIDAQTLPYAATRLKYRRLPRYQVAENCLPVILDQPYSERVFQLNPTAIGQAIQSFLAGSSNYAELALTSSHLLPDASLQELWHVVTQESGYQQVETTPLPDDGGMRCLLQKGDTQKTVTLLAAFTVLTFKNVSRAIRNGIDTIIGSTGYPIFSAKNLDDFLVRPNLSAGTDELTLISASSKDYEFRQAIDFLNALLRLEVDATVPVETRLGWFANFCRDNISFLAGEDFAALQTLLVEPVTVESLQTWVKAEPTLAAAIGLIAGQEVRWPAQVAGYITQKIRQKVTIRKEIRPDIGSIYHLAVNGQAKRVVLLADGLVVNFFARHEKGVKTEYIDPIVTMQLLSLVKLSNSSIAPGLYKMDLELRPEDLSVFWAAIDDYCRPLKFN